MSADNMMAIRRHDGKFVVTMHFMSDEGPLEPIRKTADGHYVGGYTKAFDDWEEANDYAHSEYTEYGVCDYTRIDEVANMRAQRDAYAEESEQRRLTIEKLEARIAVLEEALL